MSFRLKIFLGIAALQLLVLASIVHSGLHHIRSSNEARLMEQASVSASLLATMTADAVVALDFATLDALVGQVVRNPGLAYARIRAGNGAVLAQAGAAEALARPFAIDSSFEGAAADGLIDMAAEIEIAGRDFGRVEIGLSTDQVDDTVAEARDWLLSIAGLEILVVSMLGLVFAQLLTVQLGRLRAGARRVADGDFGYQLQVRGRDELAQTAQAFNRMSSALAAYREQAEAALDQAESRRRVAESRLLAAIDAMPHGVAIVEPTGETGHVNAAYRRLYDLPASLALAGMPFSNLMGMIVPSIRRQPFTRAGDGAIEPASETRAAKTMERLRRLRDPAAFPSWEVALTDGRIVLCTQQLMADGGIVLVDTDVTDVHLSAERTQSLERDLMRKQKLESLGTLAGGVAHEINTPAQYIGDNLHFVESAVGDILSCVAGLQSLAAEAGLEARAESLTAAADLSFLRVELPDAIAQSLQGVARIRDIVAAVKVYSHPGAADFAPCDVNAAIRNAVLVTTNQWKYAADLRQDLDPALPAIRAIDGQLGQVLVNLIVNAADSITDRRARDGQAAPPGLIGISTRALEEGGVEIRLSDNGTGIPDAIRERIFDPFFTTKPAGKGSGQGLAISRSIISDRHGGEIRIEPAEDGGTVFILTLPAVPGGGTSPPESLPGRAPEGSA